jgi:3-phenylpropionate/trans-cinnamate dioxygenase ferredoxin reductase component
MPDTPNRIAVVGGGLAGAKAVEALREMGFDGELTLVADEADLPYERPPLSKDFLQGKQEFDAAIVHPAGWYDEHKIDLRLGVAAMSLDRAAHELGLADGTTLNYDKLLLATGARPRQLRVPGGDALRYLRTRRDSEGLRAAFGPGKRVVIIGAGWIGLESAAAARAAGSTVTVVDSAELPLLAVLGPEMGGVYAALHRDNGVDLRLGASLQEVLVDDDGVATGVRLADGTIDADVVIAGVGVAPEDSLARLADLRVDNGVLVDASLRTSDPDIYAVGDVANHDHPLLGRLRVEHWANALNQPASAAAAMLGDKSARYEQLPYFYSDQYDVGMEYLGFAPSYDRVVVRGDTDAREFVAFWLDEERHVRAVMNVNVWDVVDAVRPVILERREVDPDRISDPDVAWGDL